MLAQQRTIMQLIEVVNARHTEAQQLIAALTGKQPYNNSVGGDVHQLRAGTPHNHAQQDRCAHSTTYGACQGLVGWVVDQLHKHHAVCTVAQHSTNGPHIARHESLL